MVTLDTFGYPAQTRVGTWAFWREEMRNSSKHRVLDCNHIIDPREPYRYQVGKVYGESSLFQRYDCDVCMRRDHRY